MFTIPNGQIVKTVNLSKDWARAVIDIPVPTSADLNLVNDVLHDVAREGDGGPRAAGPAAGRAAADGRGEHRARHREPADGGAHAAGQAVRGGPADARAGRPRAAPRGHRRRQRMAAHRWWRPSCTRRRPAAPRKRRRARRSRRSDVLAARPGSAGCGVSTVVLIVAFVALFWVYHNFEPRPAAAEAPPTAVVPPGFVPDPNYTWVPRTNVRRPKEPETTTTTTPTTTSPTETTTTSPGETTSPTSPTARPTTDDRSRRPGRRPPDPHADASRRRPRRRPASATGADDAGSAADSAERRPPASPLHWRAVMITLDHVTKQYKSSARPALDNVSVKIDKGEFVFLIGPSGSGKSTFMRLLLAEDTPTTGRHPGVEVPRQQAGRPSHPEPAPGHRLRVPGLPAAAAEDGVRERRVRAGGHRQARRT